MEKHKKNTEEYDKDTVWIADLNTKTNTTHILEHIDPSTVRIEYHRRKP